jgi:hypothetical protein
MQVGDVVRVVKQPANQLAHIHDYVGYIEEIQYVDGVFYAQFHQLALDGDRKGGGRVPLSHLAPETRPEWLQAKTLCDEKLAKWYAESKAYSDRYNANVEKVAKKYGVSVETALNIVREIRSLEP